MNKIAIIGFGILGKQILNFIKEEGRVDDVIIFDDTIKADFTSIFPIKEFENDKFKYYNFYVGIGYKHLHLRQILLQKLEDLSRIIPSFIHSTCYISPYSQIEKGCLLFPKCNVDQQVFIGKGNILHNSVTISHDTKLGECNYLSPIVALCGKVSIGNRIFIGAGSVVSNNVTISDNVKIGVGSCVSRDIETGTSAIGNPLKILHKELRLI